MSDAEKSLVWVTGAGGLIGNYVVQTASQLAPGWKVVGLTRADVDLTNHAAVENLFRRQKPQLILHCAAMSKSVDCQKQPEAAWRINFEATRFLAELASEIPFIFLSTDLVFDGKKGNYVETDPPNPLSVYAETKVAAEKVVLPNPKHTVLRVALNAGTSPTGDRSFIEEMRQAWQKGSTLKLFVDEFRGPIPAAATARAIWKLAGQKKPGLYHLGGSERLSRYEIGKLIADRWPQLNPKIAASSIRDYQGPPRPADTSLNCAKIQKLLSFPLPKFSEWVKEL